MTEKTKKRKESKRERREIENIDSTIHFCILRQWKRHFSNVVRIMIWRGLVKVQKKRVKYDWSLLVANRKLITAY